MEYELRKSAAFDAWLRSLRDERAKAAILDRLLRIESGLLGDRRSVGPKVSELRIDVGQGYRVYYTACERSVVLLLWGGSKRSQKADIGKAVAMAKAARTERERGGEARLSERRADYRAESVEVPVAGADLAFTPFDPADYLHGDEASQVYILRNALASGDPAYIARALGAVARARGLSALERETGIRRQTLNKSLGPKGNPTLTTLTTVLSALGLRLELVADLPAGRPPTADRR